MEEFLDKKYVLVKNENFEDYLLSVGVNYLGRKAAAALRPVQWVSRNEDGTYTFYFTSALINSEIVFTPGVEFDEVKPGGIQFRATITFEGNTMIHMQRKDDMIIKHVHEFTPEKLTVTTTSNKMDKTAKRHYVAK